MDAPFPGTNYAPDVTTANDASLMSAPTPSRYLARTLLWLALFAGGILATKDLPFFRVVYGECTAHALIEGYAAMVTGAIVYCVWVQYCAIAERRYLLTTIAFSGCLLAQVAHGVFSMRLMPENPLARSMLYDYVLGWELAIAILLIASALDRKVDDLGEVRRMGRRTVISSNILAICIAACLPLIAQWDVAVRSRLPEQMTAVRDFVIGIITNSEVHDLLLFSASFVALCALAASHSKREDWFTGSLTSFALFAVGAEIALFASGKTENVMWWAAHGLRIVGLLVLLVSLAREFGASYANAHARIAHMEAVHYMSSSLSNTLDLRVVLLTMVSDTARMLSAKYASVMLADEKGETLTTYAAHGLPELPLKPREPQRVEGSGRPGFYSGHTARAFRERKVVVVDDVFADVEFIPWRVLAFSEGYAVSVPLVYQSVPIGVLNLFFDAHVPLNDEKIKLFYTIASAAAIAVANAQLYEKSLVNEVGGIKMLDGARRAA